MRDTYTQHRRPHRAVRVSDETSWRRISAENCFFHNEDDLRKRDKTHCGLQYVSSCPYGGQEPEKASANPCVKLRAYGVEGCLLKILQSFLSGRTQTVLVNHAVSDTYEAPSGVPQGTCLGPLMFLHYVNDLLDSFLLLYSAPFMLLIRRYFLLIKRLFCNVVSTPFMHGHTSECWIFLKKNYCNMYWKHPPKRDSFSDGQY